jgi:murein tripeptide amidase MpaA
MERTLDFLLKRVAGQHSNKRHLDKQVFIFIPVFNVDGHERFGRWNRPNQRGLKKWGGVPRHKTTI